MHKVKKIFRYTAILEEAPEGGYKGGYRGEVKA